MEAGAVLRHRPARGGPETARQQVKRWLLRGAPLVAFLALWQWAAEVPVSFNFPTPWQTLVALGELLGSRALLQATATSLQSLALGFGAAVLIGVPLGLLMGVFRGLGRVTRVYLDLLIALPTAALIPLVILSFGINIVSSAVIIFVFSAPFITMNAYGGVRDTRPRLVEMARSFGASWEKLFTRIVVPSAAPMILAGLRLGLSRAFLGLIVAELLLSPFGLGKLIMNSRSMFEHDKMF
ncbi:MAG: ABC transporter permease, partial [Betaproteobacteria bacterium]